MHMEMNDRDIFTLLKFTIDQKASDLHLSAGLPPLIRVDGDIRRVDSTELKNDTLKAMLDSIMSEQQRKRYQEFLEIDFSYGLKGLARFRVNVFHQNRGLSAVFRAIPSKIPTLSDINAPSILKTIAEKHNGLVLVTGATGSGKSTTLAAMVDSINSNRQSHILTIEDPIEFIHKSNQALVSQRELGSHTQQFSTALRSALREDPDVILVGELRDLETIRLAITAAQTGHLVLSTVHTMSAAKTIDRLIDVFPAEEKAMVRSMLAESLQAVVAQQLVRKKQGGRVAAHEVMLGTPAIRNLIRENKTAQMESVLQTGRAQGMQTMQQSLDSLGVLLDAS